MNKNVGQKMDCIRSRTSSDEEDKSLKLTFGNVLHHLVKMPVLVEKVQVSLAEVLEVRGSPLTEPELWSVLCQTVEAIQDMFLPDDCGCWDDGKTLILPTTLFCTANGQVLIAKSDELETPVEFSAPEFLVSESADGETVEKLLIYSLGQTLKFAAHYSKEKKELENKLSPLLNATLDAMCHDGAELRMNLLSILELAEQHVHQFTQEKPLTLFVANLHREVLGNFPQVHNEETKDNYSQRVNKESDVDLRSVNAIENLRRMSGTDTYGRRLGYRPRSSLQSIVKISASAQDGWTNTFPKLSSRGRIKETQRSCESLSDNETRCMEILQLDVNVPRRKLEMLSGQTVPNFRSKSLADICTTTSHKDSAEDFRLKFGTGKCGNSATTGILTEQNKLENTKFCNWPTFRSNLYNIASFPNLAPTVNRRHSLTLTKSKNIVGPEFVVMSCKPSLIIAMPKCKEKQSKNMKHMKQIMIILLTGQRLETTCDLSVTKARELWEVIIDHQKLHRKFLYGLAYVKDGEFIFLEPEIKLSKVVPPGWMDAHSKNQVDITSFTIYVRIKFYMDVNLIRDKSTRHLYYLQLRRDILEERTRCDPQTVLRLGALALQTEFGDYRVHELGSDYFVPEHYIPLVAIRHLGQENIRTQLIRLHESRKGHSKSLAEFEFITEVQSLPEYGIHFHVVREGKKAKHSTPVWLGVSLVGIYTFDAGKKLRVLKQGYSWKQIQQITYDQKHFLLTTTDGSSSDKHLKLKFHADKQKSRYLFHLASSHHRLHIALDCHLKVPELFSDDSIDFQHDPDDVSNDHEISYELTHQQAKHGPSSLNSDSTNSQLYQNDGSDCNTESAFVIGTSCSTPSHVCNESISDSLAERFANLDCSPSGDRRLVTACLNKAEAVSYGLSISLGQDYGIYIRAVAPGSPADLCSILRPGDRIFSVNQRLVDCMEYEDVVELVRNCGEQLEIVVSQQILKPDLSCIQEELELSRSLLYSSPQRKDDCQINQLVQSCDSLDGALKSHSKPCPPKPPRRSIFSFKKRKTSTNSLQEPNSVQTMDPKMSGDFDVISNDEMNHPTEKCHSCFESSCSPDNCEIVKYERFVSAKFGRQLSNAKESSSLKIDEPDISTVQSGKEECGNSCTWLTNESVDAGGENCSNIELPGDVNKTSSNSANCDDLNWNEDEKEENGDLKCEDIFHVVLEKLHGSFGINIKDGVAGGDSQSHVVVQEVLPGGAADLDGRILVGDVILEVSGTNLAGATHQQAVESLRSCSPLAHLTVRRRTPTTVVRVHSTGRDPRYFQGAPVERLRPVVEEGGAAGAAKMGASSTRPNNGGRNVPIQHSSSLKNFTLAAPSESIGRKVTGSPWRLASVSPTRPTTPVPNPESPGFRTTIRVNPSGAPCENGGDAVPVIRLRRNSDDAWSTKISLGKEAPNVIRLRVNFGDAPSPATLRRSLSTDVKSIRRRSSLEWFPCTSTGSSWSSFTTDSPKENVGIDDGFECGPGGRNLSRDEHVEETSTGLSTLSTRNEKHLRGSGGRSADGGREDSSGSLPRLLPATTRCPANGDGEVLSGRRMENQLMPNLSSATELMSMSTADVNVNRGKANALLLVGDDCDGARRNSKAWVNGNSTEEEEGLEEEISVEEEYPFVTEETTFQVELEKSSRGLGLSVCGGWDANPTDSLSRLIRIKRLYPLQPAVESGKLEIGDVVLAVNSQSLIGVMYFEAIEVLRMATSPVVLTVCRPAPGVLPPIPQNSSLLGTSLMGTSMDEGDSAASSLRYTGPSYTEFDVTLTKVAGSLGFTLVKLDGPNAGHYIKALVKEPALTDGSLQPGDKIILVNGTDISEMSHSESIKFLRELPDEVTLCVWRQVGPPASPTSPLSPTAPFFEEEQLKQFRPKPLLRKEALDMLNDKSRPKGCKKNLNGGSPLASPRIRRKQMRETAGGDAAVTAAAAATVKSVDAETEQPQKAQRRISSNVSSSESACDSCSSSGIDKGNSTSSTASTDRSCSSPMSIPGRMGTDNLAESSSSPGKPERPSYLDLTALHPSPRKQMFGHGPCHKADSSEDPDFIRYMDSGDSVIGTDDGLTTVTSSEGSPVQVGGRSALLKWRGQTLGSQEDLANEKCEQDAVRNREQRSFGVISVELDRGWNGRLGFSLVAMETKEATGIYIRVVYPGSLAAMDGRLQVGDKLLQINSTSVNGMTVDEVIEVLRSQTGKVGLIVERDPENKQTTMTESCGSVSVMSSLTRSQSQQEELLSNEVSMLNAKNNNLSSTDCLNWETATTTQDENENYSKHHGRSNFQDDNART